MTPREDTFSNDVEAAAQFERERGKEMDLSGPSSLDFS